MTVVQPRYSTFLYLKFLGGYIPAILTARLGRERSVSQYQYKLKIMVEESYNAADGQKPNDNHHDVLQAGGILSDDAVHSNFP